MYSCNAVAELRVTLRSGSLGQGRAAGLRGTQSWPNFCGNSYSALWHDSASDSNSSITPDFALGRVIPASGVASKTSSALKAVLSRLEGQAFEKLLVLLFDSSGRYLDELYLTSGLQGAVFGRFRPIVSSALAAGACQLLLAHNHPSGSASPSDADIRFTENLIQICRPLEIHVVDHLIVAGPETVSMRGAQLI